MSTVFNNPYKTPQPRRLKRWIMVLLIIIIGIGSFAGGLTLGLNYTYDAKAAGAVATLKITQRLAPQLLSKEVDFSRFWELWDYLKKDAYGASKVNDIDLFYGAQAGLVAALGDPYSVFFTPEHAKQFTQELSGRFEGIGAEIGMKDGRLTIIAPLPDSPATKAGLQSGDYVIGINDEDTTGMPIDLAISKIRGKKGTVVNLKIMRKTELLSMAITRDSIKIPNLTLSYNNDIAVLKMYHFNEGVTSEFGNAVQQIKNKGIKKIILDLRNNPGGYLDAAIAITSYWLPSDAIVTFEKSADNSLKSYMSTGNQGLKGVKTIVLINGGSASASEILAGALQDYNLATLVGEKTFGKGSVQNFKQFDDGSAVKLTIAAWLTPKQRAINELGINPDLEVKAEESGDNDPQLQKAIEILND